MNWGPWRNSAQLERVGLKCNRVPIPGDWDYAATGRCTTEVQALAEQYQEQTGKTVEEVYK